MHIRNLVKAGQSSHTISLPKQWLDRYNLKKGDPIYLKETSTGNLIISPKQIEEKQEKRDIYINIDRKELSHLQREITSAYINNYNSIILKGKNTAKIKQIRDIIHTFVALEIAEVDSDKIIAKDLLNLKEISMSKTIQRMDIILRSILKDCPQAFEDKHIQQSIHYRDEDINRLYFMMFRLLKSALKDNRLLSQWEITPDKVLSLWYLIINIESLSDTVKSITKQLSLNPKLNKKEFTLIQETLQHEYRKVMKAYYASDKDAAQEVASMYNPFTEQCDEFFKKNKTFEVSTTMHLHKEAFNLVCNIARIVIDEDTP